MACELQGTSPAPQHISLGWWFPCLERGHLFLHRGFCSALHCQLPKRMCWPDEIGGKRRLLKRGRAGMAYGHATPQKRSQIACGCLLEDSHVCMRFCCLSGLWSACINRGRQGVVWLMALRCYEVQNGNNCSAALLCPHNFHTPPSNFYGPSARCRQHDTKCATSAPRLCDTWITSAPSPTTACAPPQAGSRLAQRQCAQPSRQQPLGASPS